MTPHMLTKTNPQHDKAVTQPIIPIFSGKEAQRGWQSWFWSHTATEPIPQSCKLLEDRHYRNRRKEISSESCHQCFSGSTNEMWLSWMYSSEGQQKEANWQRRWTVTSLEKALECFKCPQHLASTKASKCCCCYVHKTDQHKYLRHSLFWISVNEEADVQILLLKSISSN